MKRTAEIRLTSIGLGLTTLAAALIIIFMSFSNTDSFKEFFQERLLKETQDQGAAVTSSDVDLLFDTITGIGGGFLVSVIISAILGAISLYFFRRNKKPIAASILSLIAAVVIGVGTLLFGFIPALLFLIAGIVGLVRKRPIIDPFEPPTN